LHVEDDTMPIHTFECEFCGHVFEELILRDADEAELVCPQCGATKPSRRLSAPARVRGSGVAAPPSCSPGGG